MRYDSVRAVCCICCILQGIGAEDEDWEREEEEDFRVLRSFTSTVLTRAF